MTRPQSTIARTVSSLYLSKSTALKLFLLAGVLAISAVFVWYTFDVIEKLKVDTRSQVDKYVKMWQLAANSSTSGQELQFIFDEIIVKANFPIIVLDEAREPIHWRNIEEVDPADTNASSKEMLAEIAAEMVEQNGEFPLFYGDIFVNYFCYGDSQVIDQLKLMPFIEIGIVMAFMIIGIIGFQNIRRSEERHIWVGMAKETAHQLGTPISSLLGWLELMAHEAEESGDNDKRREGTLETIENMKVDVVRLRKVAKRFGLIGSVPELEPANLDEAVKEVVEYYRRRLPFEGKGVRIEFKGAASGQVDINSELFGWVLENLIKNSLQAVDPRTGRIELRTEPIPEKNQVLVQIKDNGGGISAAAARKVFRAGFTTKKRGWGLGLTLVKRIVEEYHGGRVSLKRSRPGETIMEISLPLRKLS